MSRLEKWNEAENLRFVDIAVRGFDHAVMAVVRRCLTFWMYGVAVGHFINGLLQSRVDRQFRRSHNDAAAHVVVVARPTVSYNCQGRAGDRQGRRPFCPPRQECVDG
jgi:hypothetical protein